MYRPLDANGSWCSIDADSAVPSPRGLAGRLIEAAEAAGKSMQRGWGRAGARPASTRWSQGRVTILLAGLGLSACVNAGQIVNLTEGRPGTTVAFESINGPPP